MSDTGLVMAWIAQPPDQSCIKSRSTADLLEVLHTVNFQICKVDMAATLPNLLYLYSLLRYILVIVINLQLSHMKKKTL